MRTAGVFAVALLLAGCGSSGHSKAAATQVVPSVVGHSLSQTFTLIFKRGICLNAVTFAVEGTAKSFTDRIASQTPPAGARVSKGSGIDVIDHVHTARGMIGADLSTVVHGIPKGLKCPQPKVRVTQ